MPVKSYKTEALHRLTLRFRNFEGGTDTERRLVDEVLVVPTGVGVTYVARLEGRTQKLWFSLDDAPAWVARVINP